MTNEVLRAASSTVEKTTTWPDTFMVVGVAFALAFVLAIALKNFDSRETDLRRQAGNLPHFPSAHLIRYSTLTVQTSDPQLGCKRRAEGIHLGEFNASTNRTYTHWGQAPL